MGGLLEQLQQAAIVEEEKRKQEALKEQERRKAEEAEAEKIRLQKEAEERARKQQAEAEARRLRIQEAKIEEREAKRYAREQIINRVNPYVVSALIGAVLGGIIMFIGNKYAPPFAWDYDKMHKGQQIFIGIMEFICLILGIVLIEDHRFWGAMGGLVAGFLLGQLIYWLIASIVGGIIVIVIFIGIGLFIGYCIDDSRVY